MNTEVESDTKVILEHIKSIFQAYLNRDREAIRRLHTDDWIGFQGPSMQIERGIDAYMKNAEKSLEAFHGSGFQLLDTEVQVFGDVAIIYYIARYEYRNPNGSAGTVPLRSADIYRRIDSQWNQIGSHIAPIPSGGKWGEGKSHK